MSYPTKREGNRIVPDPEPDNQELFLAITFHGQPETARAFKSGKDVWEALPELLDVVGTVNSIDGHYMELWRMDIIPDSKEWQAIGNFALFHDSNLDDLKEWLSGEDATDWTEWTEEELSTAINTLHQLDSGARA